MTTGQIFTKPIQHRPNVLLRDHRAPRLGRVRDRDLKALFEAIELEQAKRGNL
jgi:hypothetical protein